MTCDKGPESECHRFSCYKGIYSCCLCPEKKFPMPPVDLGTYSGSAEARQSHGRATGRGSLPVCPMCGSEAPLHRLGQRGCRCGCCGSSDPHIPGVQCDPQNPYSRLDLPLLLLMMAALLAVLLAVVR